MYNSDSYIEMVAAEKLRYAIEAKKLSNELVEHLGNSLRWVLYYCAKNNLPLPDQEKISGIIDRAIDLEQNFNRKLTGRKSTDKLPDPQNNILIRYWYRTLR